MNTTKRTIVSLLTCIFCTLTVFSQNYPLSLEDKEKLNHAIELVDGGKVDSSLYILEALVKKYPKNYIVNYEYAFSLVRKGDYKGANKTVRKLENHPEANDALHAMIGNTYDFMGQPDKALKAYQNGLKKFPNSGLLYVEQGNVYFNQQKYEEALNYYEHCIEMAPMYPTGYLRASMIYLSSSEPIWGMIYAEMFSLLKPNARECRALCDGSVAALRKNIKMLGDTALQVSLTYKNSIYIQKKPKADDLLNALSTALTAFEVKYEHHVFEAVKLIGYKDTIDFDLFCKIRQNVADSIVKTDYSLGLFKFQKSIIDAGFWQAYNMLIYGKSFPTEYAAFMADEEKVNQLKAFMTWYNTAANFPNEQEPVSKNVYEKKMKDKLDKEVKEKVDKEMKK